ncbi:MAG TPA: exodeoxyribonuclease V subunit gamma [Polyangiaceae bacterium]
MVRLVYSNRTEELLAELATRVRAQQARDGALVPVRLVVPNGSVEGYVRLGIAREQGIAANLDTSLLTRFAGETTALLDRGARVADAEALEAMALALLLDDALLAGEDLAAVRAYLHAAGDRAEAVDVRRVQLAARVGRIFEEYTYSRGELLVAWNDGLALDAAHAETERWQRRLWLAMFGEGGLARARTPRIVPLHEAVGALEPRAELLPRAVHVFGFAHVGRTFHELLQRLGRVVEVVVYTLTPCEGFWEDVDRRDPAPLQLWSRPGRDHVRALNALAGFDHDDRFVDPMAAAPRTLLRQLQGDVLRREAPAAPAEDASVVVLEHASIRRECEAVASAIWDLMREDESLRFDDVAVLVPPGDAAAYAAHLPAAFREAHELPHQIVGLPPVEPGRIEEAIELLLALPLGRFTRAELLRLAVHPAVAGGLREVDTERWLAWCDALGVVHGADRADHEGTYIDRDILNWDQGLRRLALGAFMVGDASGDGTPFLLGDDAYVPHEVAGSELHDAASFGVLLRSLLADATFAAKRTMTTREWAEFLRAYVEAYVAPASDAEADQLSRVLRRLHALSEVDLGDRAVGYRVAAELARARLARGAASRGGEGVVVSTLAAIRPLPFRVVFACGMGEGRFPSPDAEDPLDLRWAKRREGDVTARDRDRYAFLELLLGARDRVLLSYVSRDPLTGDALAPSSVVQELLHTLAGGYVRDVSSLTRRHPLRRWDPAYFPELFRGPPSALGTMALPEARAEARTLALRRSLERQGGHLSVHEVQMRAEQGDPAWAALRQHLRLTTLPPAPPLADGRVVVPMYAIVKFLELPLQGWARFRLGLDDQEEEDVMARENEPFETDLRKETMLLREVILEAAARGEKLEAAYDAKVRERELRGRGPSGVFATGERGDHLRALETWEKALAENAVPYDSIELYRFGRAGEHARAGEVHDSLVLDVGVEDAAGVTRMVRAEVTGRTLPLGPGATASITLSKRANEGTDEWATAGRKLPRIRAFVDHALLAATGLGAERRHTSLLVVATTDEPVIDSHVLPPLTQDEARGWLRDRVRELLGQPHAYFLPAEAVFLHAAGAADAPVVPILEAARDRLRGGDGPLALRSAYGPVPRPQDYPIPDEATARAMIAARFGALLRRPPEEP